MWKPLFRIVAGAAGVLLLAAGLWTAWWWFYTMAPVRRTLDQRWIDSHSQQEYWQEVQSGIRRGTWTHDDGFTVGWYGDKSWAEWIMARVKPGDSMYCLGAVLFHSQSSMQHITNQDAGRDADGWLVWWAKNKDRSQREWMIDGFALHGVKVDFPPTPQQTETLLGLLGSAGDDEKSATPDYVQYNAFRWLRDSGFEPVPYLLSLDAVSEEASAGIRKYAQWEERFPRACNVGILKFDSPGTGKVASTKSTRGWMFFFSRRSENAPGRVFLMPHYQLGVHATIWLPLAIGLGLVAWSVWRIKRKKED